MACRRSTQQSLIAAASLATALALASFPANAGFVVPPVGPGECVANCPGSSSSTSSSSPSSSSSSPSSSSSSSSSAAARAAKLQRLRQRQIEANNIRLRSIDKARSKLTYPNVIENFFRSPSIEEQWRQSEEQKKKTIRSLKRYFAAKKARINKILGDRPPDWDGSLRPPGTEPDYPFFSKGSKDSAPVALGGDTPADLKGGVRPPTSERAQAEAEVERSRQARALAEDIRAEIAKTFGPSPRATDVTFGEMLHSFQKYVSNEEMLKGFGSEAFKIWSVVSGFGAAVELRGWFVARAAAQREAAKLAGGVGKLGAASGAAKATKAAEQTFLYVTKSGKTIDSSKLTLREAKKLYESGKIVGRKRLSGESTVEYWDFATGQKDIIVGKGYGPITNRIAQKAMDAGVPPEVITGATQRATGAGMPLKRIAGGATGATVRSGLVKKPEYYKFPTHYRGEVPKIPNWLFRENPYKSIRTGSNKWAGKQTAFWSDASSVRIRRTPELDKELQWVLTGKGGF